MKIHEGHKTKELTSTVRNVKAGPEKHGYTYQLTEKEHKAMKIDPGRNQRYAVVITFHQCRHQYRLLALS